MSYRDDEVFYKEIARKLTREYWGVELTCPIEFVRRDWKSTNGYFVVNNKTGDCKIVMSHAVNARRGTGPTIETLKHELVHWYLWSVGEPNDDSDDTFIRECLRVGASISGTKKAQAALKRVRGETD